MTSLPTLELTQKEFDNLYEYSCSIPTGTKIGTRWKRKKNYHDASKGWVVGEYYDIGSKTQIGIRWYEVRVIEPNSVEELIHERLYGVPTLGRR